MWRIWWSSSRSRSAGLFVRLRAARPRDHSRQLHAFCGKTKRLSAPIRWQGKFGTFLDYRRNLLISGGQFRGAGVFTRVTEDYRVINSAQRKLLPQKFPQGIEDRNGRGLSGACQRPGPETQAADGGWRTAGLPDPEGPTGAGWSRVWQSSCRFPFQHEALGRKARRQEPGCQTWCCRPGRRLR
jgi:hypothetical protein